MLLGTATLAHAAGASLPARIAFDEPLTGPSTIATTLDALPRTARLPVMARIEINRQSIEPDGNGTYHFEALDARLALYRDKQIPVWLTLERVPTPDAISGITQDEAWGRFVRTLARHLANRVAVVELVLPDMASLSDAAVDRVGFDVKRAAVELHGADGGVLVALGAERLTDAARLESFYARDLSAYLDAIVITSGQSREASAARAILDRLDPTALVFERGATLEGDASAAWRAFISAELWRLGTASALASYRAMPGILQTVLRQAPTFANLLAGEFTRIDEDTSQLTMEPPAAAPGAPVRRALVYDTAKFGTYLIYAAAADAPAPAGATGTVRVSLKIASESKPTVRDPLTGATREIANFTRDSAAQRTTFTAPLLPQPLIVDFNDSLGNVVTERSEVKGKTALSVAEIIARHQQVQAAQDGRVRTYAVSARMEQHFRPAISDPGYDVVTENRFFVDDEQIEWEELSFSVNGSTWKENRPPFPLLQPEKVLSVPLKLRMTADYRYRLAGTETIDGHECYVIHFDPSRSDQSLYRGVVWIDTETFVRRKLQAVQTKLSAPVVSNEETHHFEQIATLDGRTIILPTRITSHQIVLIAGRNLLVDKETTFSGYDINAEAFKAQRQEARASNRIMYRDTDHGVRYLMKEGEQRVVREKPVTTAKAIAMGTTIDPSFDFPLPIFGINYLDFNFHGPDSQLALLFAGVLALGNIQRPKLFGTPLDGSVDFFAIAAPVTDSVFDSHGERKTERLLSWPMSTGVNIGYQFNSFQKISGQYQFRFDPYIRDGRYTPDTYVAPSSTTTHGLGLSYEFKRGGYSVVANGTWYGRAHWEPWGPADNIQTTARTYDKYSLNISKDWYLGLFQKVHLNGAYFGGDRLDRFSQYQFGMFDDTKVHGVPSAGVRYGELTMARGSYSFNVFEQYRFDLFVEQAVGRDRALHTDWERITGLGAAVNVKGPWTTILKVDVGKSFLPERYRATGSTVIQILVLKPLGKG
jgi:hypothetical protein